MRLLPAASTPGHQILVRRATVLAAIASAMTAIAVPALYLTIALRYELGALQTRADVVAVDVSKLIAAHPGTWQFQQHRLEVLLVQPGPHTAPYAHRLLTGDVNAVVVQSTGDVTRPMITRSAPLFDTGVPVGRVEIQRSIRALLINTGGLAILGVLLGGLVFTVGRVWPLRALVQSEERFQAVVGSALDGILLTDGAGRITFWNASARTIFGHAASGMVGPSFPVLLSEASAAAYGARRAQIAEVDASAPRAQLIELSGVRRDGSEFPMEVSISAWQHKGDTAYLHVVPNGPDSGDSPGTVSFPSA